MPTERVEPPGMSGITDHATLEFIKADPDPDETDRPEPEPRSLLGVADIDGNELAGDESTLAEERLRGLT